MSADNVVVIDPTPTPVPAAPAVNVDQVKKIVEGVEQFLSIAGALAAFTPTKTDDQLVAYAVKALQFIKPFVGEPWVPELIDFVLNLIHKPAKASEVLAAAKAAL